MTTPSKLLPHKAQIKIREKVIEEFVLQYQVETDKVNGKKRYGFEICICGNPKEDIKPKYRLISYANKKKFSDFAKHLIQDCGYFQIVSRGLRVSVEEIKALLIKRGQYIDSSRSRSTSKFRNIAFDHKNNLHRIMENNPKGLAK